jgi:hypothetical protein
MSFMVPYDPTTECVTSLPAATLLERVIPPDVLAAVVSRHRPAGSRQRKLPGPLVLLLVIAMFLYPATELSTVLAILLLARRVTQGGDQPAGKSSISRARYRWGPRPLAALLRQVCQPLATASTPGAFLFGLRTVAFDASYEDVADTPENDRVFGRYRSQYGPSAYPQLMGMYLVECGTHAILDAGPWPCHTSEHRAVRRLLRSLQPEMLVLWDCGLHGYPLAVAVRQRRAHVLTRVPAYQTFEPVRVLADGSLLALWFKDPPSRRPKTTPPEHLLVRVVTYTLDTSPTVLRLVTSLLDPVAAPALDLVCGYHERWEIELTFDELGRRQRLVAQPLRSQKPQGVVQEFYGLVLAHYVVRAVMAQAAAQQGQDPDRLSFSRAVRLVSAALPLGDVLAPAERDLLLGELTSLLLRSPLPARRQRAVPRARKRPWAKHRLRKRTPHYQITPLPSFRSRVPIHAPPQPAAA